MSFNFAVKNYSVDTAHPSLMEYTPPTVLYPLGHKAKHCSCEQPHINLFLSLRD